MFKNVNREAFGQELTILQSKHFRMAARYYLLNEGSIVIRDRPRPNPKEKLTEEVFVNEYRLFKIFS